MAEPKRLEETIARQKKYIAKRKGEADEGAADEQLRAARKRLKRAQRRTRKLAKAKAGKAKKAE